MLFFIFCLCFFSGCEDIGFIDVRVPVAPDAPEDSNPSSFSSTVRFTAEWTQAAVKDRYDFLWVVDNSGSMQQVRDVLSDSVNDFVSILQSRKSIDYQMAITTTDFFAHSGRLMRLGDGHAVVRSAEGGANETFRQILSLVGPSQPDTSFWEQGLESAAQAISNSGNEFLRDGVPLVIVFLTNEDDYSCRQNCFGPEPENPNRAFPVILYSEQRYTNYLSNLGREVLIYPVVIKPGDTCIAQGSAGSRYMDVKSTVSPQTESQSICGEKVRSSLERISSMVADRNYCFAVEPSQGAMIEVRAWVDGVEVSSSQFTVNEGKFCFEQAPEPGASIRAEMLLTQ